MNEFERLMAEAYDDGVVTEVIRPAAIAPEEAARLILVEMAMRDVHSGGHWQATPTLWRRFDRAFAEDEPLEDSHVLGSLQVAYGTPTRYDITIYRATVTTLGQQQGWTVESLVNEALGYGGLDLASCPRADLQPPPAPFRG